MSNIIYRDAGDVMGAITVAKSNDENKLLEFSFASDTPHRRFDWESWEVIEEVLDCREGAIVGDRLQSGLISFLWNHDPNSVRGVIQGIDWRSGKGYATAKLSRSAVSEQLLKDIEDEIVKGISVGYRVAEYEEISKAVWSGDRWESELISPKKVRATKWEIFEISAVSIPADATVGIGRSDRPIPQNLPQLIGSIGVDKIKKALGEMTDQKTEIRNHPDYLDLDQKYRDSQAQLNTHKAENDALRGQVGTLQGELSKLKSEAEISKKYASLRSEAEEVVRATKLSAHEFEELFSRTTEQILAETDPASELRAIELVLNMRKKSAAQLNTQPSKVPAELPQDTARKSAQPDDKGAAILSYESAWK